MDASDFQAVKALVERARESGHWLVLGGHEIGDSGPQTTRVEMLTELIPYLRDASNEVWFETVGAVAQHLSQIRER